MKKFTIEVSHASSPQLATIALELKIMSNAWEKFGPKIWINSQKLQAPSATIWPDSFDIKLYVKERSKQDHRRAVSTRQNA